MKVVVVTPDRDNHFTLLEKEFGAKFHYVRNHDVFEILEINPSIVLFLADWTWDLVRCIEVLRKERIPTVLLMDGMIDWNHFFENPKWSYGGNETPYIPIYCDKVFTPGANSARFLEFFGNNGVCEVTGLPRFDCYKDDFKLSTTNSMSVRVGVMSSNTAGYTKDQIISSVELFTSVYHQLNDNLQYEIKWRLRKGFNKQLPFEAINSSEKKLKEFLSNVDIVICQPSTAAFESMAMGKPTAIADFGVTPNYMRGAWEIRRPRHILPIVEEMAKLPRYKEIAQNYILYDSLANLGCSSKVCLSVMRDMVAHVSGLSKDEWFFPQNMAEKYNRNPARPIKNNFNFSELEQVEEMLRKASVKITNLENQLSRRGAGYWLERLIKKLRKK